MAYQINKTDGTIVAVVADGQVDNLSTDLTLIGKNYSGFGEALNENFIKLLENFSSTTRPTNPIKGQIWFDVSESKLKVYNGIEFLPVSSATISNTQPSTLAVGDLWFDDVNGQLYFYDGTNPILLGPSYSKTQGLSGLKVESILDTLNQTRVITSLYNNGILLGIFAKDSFTPKNLIVGFNGNIQPGFNAGTLSGIKFNVTCTNAEQLGGALSTTYVRKDTSNTIDGQVRLTGDGPDQGLVVGSAGQLSLFVSNSDVYLANTAANRNMIFRVINGLAQEDAITINSATQTVGLYTAHANSQVNIGGNLTIFGNLTVEGTTTTVNTSNVTIEDKNITIANVSSPSNITADGAGITIKGTTDKTITYSSSNNWLDISEDINLASEKSFLIGGQPMIEPIIPFTGEYRLGYQITEIPGVANFGKQQTINIGPGTTLDSSVLRITAGTDLENPKPRISTLSSNLDLELAPDGAGNVALIGLPRITGMADPINLQDAATKEYTDKKIETRDIIFSIDLSDGKPNSYIISNILNGPDAARPGLAEDPATASARGNPSLYREGTKARILCNILTNNTSSLEINPLRSTSSQQFLTDISGSTSPGLTNVSFGTATIPSASISVTRIIKVFEIIGNSWAWISDSVLPP